MKILKVITFAIIFIVSFAICFKILNMVNNPYQRHSTYVMDTLVSYPTEVYIQKNNLWQRL